MAPDLYCNFKNTISSSNGTKTCAHKKRRSSCRNWEWVPTLQILFWSSRESGTFYAYDINPAIIRRSKKINSMLDRGHQRPSLKVAQVDGAKLPLPDNSVDLVITNNLTGIGKDKAYTEAYRVLKPGGRILDSFTEFFAYPLHSKLLKSELSEIGFVNTRSRIGTPVFVPPFVINGIPFPIPTPACHWFTLAEKPGGRQQ